MLTLRNAHNGRNLQEETSIRVGDLVLVHEHRAPRHMWKCARVEQVIKGRDGKIRSCHLKTTTGSRIKRPIQLLFPLELSL